MAAAGAKRLYFYLVAPAAANRFRGETRLRRVRADLARPVRAFGYPVVPGLYLVALLFLAVVLLVEKPLYTTAGLAIVALGVPVYLVWRRANRRA